MTATPVAVDWQDGRPVLDAPALAALFGMTEVQLRSEMVAGRITSLVERGEGADAGCWRLTLRWRSQVRCLQVGPDGLAVPVDPPESVTHDQPALFRMIDAHRTGPRGTPRT